MLSQEQLEVALKAFGEALPKGTTVHAMKVTPTVGFTDQGAAPLMALVLAESPEDFQRISQIVDRGLAAFETEPGLTAALIRAKPMSP